MNIAFDIDGVLTDISKFQLEEGEKFFKDKYKKGIVNPNGYSIKEIFDCSDLEEYEFWKSNLIKYSLSYPPRVGAKETIDKLINEGNKIFIISSRIKCSDNDIIGKLIKYIVIYWFKKNNIKYDNIMFCSVKNSAIEKSKCCVENNIDYIIEDNIENIEEISKKTKVICYETDYNSKYENDKVIKIKNFNDIYQLINRENSNFGFKFLKREERNKLNLEELKKYYTELKKYYEHMTDTKKIESTEKNYTVIYPLLNAIFKKRYAYEVENAEKLPLEDGCIYVANHRDMIDPPLIMSAIGNKKIHLLLKAEFLDSIIGGFFKSIGCVFVKRDDKDSQILSKEELIKIIFNGGNILMFPEGTRNKTSENLLDFKLGAVSISQVTGAPIVPIAITKKFDDYKEKLVLRIGDPIKVSYTDDLIEKNQMLKETIETMYLSPRESNKVKIK